MSAQATPYGIIDSPQRLGRTIREKRKADGLTQAEAAGLCGVGIRFLSELERGKAGAELGKVLQVLRGLGLVVTIAPRGGSFP
jgi:y4mF family transcriptional regulator